MWRVSGRILQKQFLALGPFVCDIYLYVRTAQHYHCLHVLHVPEAVGYSYYQLYPVVDGLYPRIGYPVPYRSEYPVIVPFDLVIQLYHRLYA